MRQLTQWTVEYLDGRGLPPKPVQVPHAWNQDVDLRWDGPAIYRTLFTGEAGEMLLRFEGVSYAAEVWINGEYCLEHYGIWDLFTVPLPESESGRYEVEVRVMKNGGRYPVQQVLSGFLPYVFGTFGGIFRPVYVGGLEIFRTDTLPQRQTEVRGRNIYWRGERFRARGVLTWGWYPELGHPNPDDTTIRKEIQQVKELGFNLIKFCLWLPPHRYLELMDEHGLAAWIELPLWLVEGDEQQLEDLRDEALDIAGQYDRHPNIVFWTAGCELSHSTPAAWRERLVEDLKRVTGSPLVKDNSGGAEMYGGDPREFGTFEDFHPYCDTHFYPVVLDSLRSGVRRQGPILLGEFNDIDLYRPLRDLTVSQPFWASADPVLNDQGVRWQYDLPAALARRDVLEPTERCVEVRSRLSESKARFLREYVMDAVSQTPEIQGYVITGWRDTPISTAGFVDDVGTIKDALRPAHYTQPVRLSLVPRRKPPWVAGGNRPGWVDRYVVFANTPQMWLLAIDSDIAVHERLEWTLAHPDGAVLFQGSFEVEGSAHTCQVHGEMFCPGMDAGSYCLTATVGEWRRQWWIESVADLQTIKELRFDTMDSWPSSTTIVTNERGWQIASELEPSVLEQWREGAPTVIVPFSADFPSRPFWRESTYETHSELGHKLMNEDLWHLWMGLAPDRVLPTHMAEELKVQGIDVRTDIARVDTRTYESLPLLISATSGPAPLIITTVRLYGGHGNQPLGMHNNPAGHWFVHQALT